MMQKRTLAQSCAFPRIVPKRKERNFQKKLEHYQQQNNTHKKALIQLVRAFLWVYGKLKTA
ncbi:hypothetical protein AM218_06485 [Hymenobacter sp. DG25A]|nr:hypothetical protein AM218_06485 [Hymenobacter sp. DG25A]